ncbi:MAG: HDOD domain-containing protein, partial [Bacillota bacterium]
MSLVPEPEKSRAMLDEAGQLNRGPWYTHSLHVANAARAIAVRCPGLIPDRAYSLGLLHDIGRRYGVTALKHVIDGYRFLSGLGYEDAARICLTHSFPLREIGAFAGQNDCDNDEAAFIDRYIRTVESDDYDHLIQLCDALALPAGLCLLEQRFVDVVMRHGFNQFTINKWKAFYGIRDHFENIIGCSIYDCVQADHQP